MAAINTQVLRGQWNQIRGQVKQRWGQLTDDDLKIHAGDVDQLVGLIQQKTGEGREAIESFLSDLTSRGSSAFASAAESVKHAADRLGDGYGRVAEQARERYDQVEEVVRHNPAQAVASAFCVGLVFGVVVGLALRSR